MRKFTRTSTVAAAAAAALALGGGVAGATPGADAGATAPRVQNGQYTFHVYGAPLQPPVASVAAEVAGGHLISNGIVLPFELVPFLESDGTVNPEGAFVELHGAPVGFLEAPASAS